jgi:GTP-binding protein
MPLPLVAIVGAPNVGKSTLFNRFLGGRRAIVTDQPGVTRDRLYGEVRDVSRPFRIVDTGGLIPGDAAPFAREIEEQAAAALDEASVVLFMVDARAGATGLDQELAQMLLRRGCRPLLVANKVDSGVSDNRLHELHALGLGPPLAISAEHGRGIDELLDEVGRLLPTAVDDEDRARRLSVAIVGRPNVGKSSLLNRLVGAERVVVSDEPGTTRDAVDTLLDIGERRYRLVDTAGLRRAGKVREIVEHFSVQRARQNIERCDVALLVLDATESLAAQDAHVAGYILDALKPMAVVVNKWDLVENREAAVKRWEEWVRRRLRFTRGAPIVFVSATSGQRVLKILDLVDEVHAAAGIRVPTQLLNRWLQTDPASVPAAGPRAPGFRVYYATQTGVHPPRFVLFCNDPSRAHFSARRRIENGLRRSFGFGPVPIRLDFRPRREARER